MPQKPFPHNGPIYYVSDHKFEVAYYSHNKLKYKRVRERGKQSWLQVTPQLIDADHFWMVAACIERVKA